MSFVSSLLEYTNKYESPKSFWQWSAYATIAATLRDNVYRKQGDITTFPNIFVLFLAASGARKGNPINLAQRLLKQIDNTKVISGRSSIQAILDELNHTETNKTTGKLVKGGSAILLAGELAASIVNDVATISILTDIYDLKQDFKHHLRGSGKFHIEQIVFSMLAGSNAELLKEVYTGSAIRGGLLARTFVIVPDEYRPANSLLDANVNEEGFKSLVNGLGQISQLKGEIFVTEEAKKEFEDWYRPWYASLKTKADKNGVLARLHMGVIKLSFILAANDLELNLRKKHIEESIDLCVSLIPNYNNFNIMGGKSTLNEAGQLLLEELVASKEGYVSRRMFLREHWNDVDSDLLDKLVVTLDQAGIIEQRVSGGDITFHLKEKRKGMVN